MAAKVVEFKTDLREQQAVEVFKREILDPYWEFIILVLFFDPGCVPSRTFMQRGQYMPYVVENAGDNVVICKIDPNEGGNRVIADQYETRAFPTVAFVHKGRFLRRVTGAVGAETIMRVLGECKRGRY